MKGSNINGNQQMAKPVPRGEKTNI